jgi:hypothetical protein
MKIELRESIPIIYPAFSKRNFFLRDQITCYVVREGGVPLNPFGSFGYFLADVVERDLVRRCNNNLVRICDSIWVFGDIANGVFDEIKYARSLGKPVRYFSLGSRLEEIVPVSLDQMRFESELTATKSLSTLGAELAEVQ